MKNKTFYILLSLLFSCSMPSIVITEDFIEQEYYHPKIAFSFDDQMIESWYPSLKYLKNKYPEFTAIVFVCRPYTFEEGDLEKYLELYDLGFEIGAHNWAHNNSVDYLSANGEQSFIELQYQLIDYWSEYGVEIKSFAYPYGSNNNETDSILENIYDVVRDIHGDWDVEYGSNIIGAFSTDEWGNVENQFLSVLEENKDTNNIVTTYGHNLQNEDIGFTTTLDCMESWIQYCIENDYEFINMHEIN